MADNVRLLHGKQSGLDSQPIVGGKVYFAISDEGKGKIYFDVPGQVLGSTNPVRIEMNDEVNFATKAQRDALGNEITGYLKTLTQNGNKIIGTSVSGDSQEVRTIPFIVGAHTSSTNAWTGSTNAITELYDGLTILYYLPYKGNGQAVTLNLGLGTTNTGAIPCYYKASETLKNHYDAGTVLLLTYRKNASAQGLTNAVTGWFAGAQFEDGNSEIIAYKKSSGTYPILGSETILSGIATTGTGTEGVVSATEISMSPATGTITATKFDGTATRAVNDEAGNKITETYITDISVEKGENNEHSITVTKGGVENTFSLTDIDTHVHADSSASTKAFLMGSTTSNTGVKTAIIDPNIYTTTTAGELVASQFTGKLVGNADTATTATKDSAGNNIAGTYVKTIALNNETVTVTKGTGGAVNAFTIPDKKVNITLDTDTKAYLLGTTANLTTTNSARTEAIADSGVYLSNTPGELVATTFKGNLTGEADTAKVADKANSVDWKGVANRPNPVISIANEDNTISYKTFDGQNHELGTYAPLDATGIIPLEYIPKGAKEELKIYDSLTAIQTAITNGEIQVGDTALDNSEGIMYFIYNNNGTITYQEYKAGKASSVDWGDVQNRPDLVSNVALDSTKTKVIITKEGATTTLTPSFLPLSGGTVSGKTMFNNDVVVNDITISDSSISNDAELEINGLTIGATSASMAGTLSTTGAITAPQFSGVADKAIADEGGQDIRDTYISSITSDASRAGTTLTYTDGRGNGTTVKVEDPNVTQTLVNNNANYPILMGAAAQTATTTGQAYFDSGVTVNPSTNTINASISGTAANATNADSADFANKATGDTENIRDKYIASVQSNATSGTKIDFYNGAGEIIDTVYAADTKTDTKNTAGASNTSKKIFLIGAETQGANPQTYSHDTVFIDADGKLNATNNFIGDLEGNAESATSASYDEKRDTKIHQKYIVGAQSNATSGTKIELLNAEGTVISTIYAADTKTDTKVTQTATSSGTYPLLLSNKTDGATGTTTARFDSGVTLNTSTNTISANISGNAATADYADEAAQADKGLVNFEDVTKTSDNTGTTLEFVKSNGSTKSVHIDDRFVEQESVTTGEFPLLFAQSDSDQTNITYFNKDITIDIDTNTINANISGVAETAKQAETATSAGQANNNYFSVTQHPATGVHSFTLSKPNGEQDTITFTDADTKDTVGSQNVEEKIYLVGTLAQGTAEQGYARSYTNSQVFVEDGTVYSEGKKVLTDTDLTWDNIEGKPSDYIQTITKATAATTKDTNLAIEWKDESGATTKWSPNFLPASGGTVTGDITASGTAKFIGNLSGKATTAGTADTANSVAWGNVSNKPQLIQDVSYDTTTNEFKETVVGGSAATVAKLPNLDTNNKIPSKFIPTATNTAIGGTKIYTSTGANADGTMTQKAITDAIATAETGATSAATTAAKSYTDQKFNDLLGPNATEALDTITELATALAENEEVIDALNDAIGTKANASDLTAHINNKSNPHEVGLDDLGISATSAELNVLDGATVTTAELNALGNLTANRAVVTNASGQVAASAVTATELGYLDGVTSAIQTQLNNKAASSTVTNHIADKNNPHQVTLNQLGVTVPASQLNGTYAGSNSVGGPANEVAIPRITKSILTLAYETPVDTERIYFGDSDATDLDCPTTYCIINIKKGNNHRTILDAYNLNTGDHYINGNINAQTGTTDAWTGWNKQDIKVRQYSSAENKELPLLARYNNSTISNNNYEDASAKFDTDVTLNPSTGVIKAKGFSGDLTGTADKAKANFESVSQSGSTLTFTTSGGATTSVTLPNDNTDTKVAQTADTSTATAIPILFAGTNTSGTAAGAKYNTGITITPSTKTITATKFKGALEGKADTAGTADKANANFASVTQSGSTLTFTTSGGATSSVTLPNDNTDTNVTQTATTTGSFPLLLANTTTTATTTSRFDSGVTLNTATNTISANVSGNAATADFADEAGSVDWGDVANKPNSLVESIAHTDTTLTYKHVGGSDATWSPKFLPLTGGTVSGNITATKFIGALQGNADSATNATNHIADKSNPHGVTLAQLGVTATAAELNKLDGVTASTAEINKLKGLTATTAELNYIDGVTSNIQTQLNNANTKITNNTTAINNHIADKNNPHNVTLGQLGLTSTADKYNDALKHIVHYVKGTGTTAGTWLGSIDGLTAYYDGLAVAYCIPIAGASTTTLNLNSLGAKTIYRYGTTKLTTQHPVGTIVFLIYSAEKSAWYCSDYDANSYAYVKQYVTDATNANYPLLFSYDVTGTITSGNANKYARLDNDIYYNPSTGTLTAAIFDGIATSANSVEWDNIVGKPATVITSISGNDNTSLSWTSQDGSAGTWSPAFLSLDGGTVSGNITATKFIGALQGNADSATNATNAANVPWGGVSNKPQLIQDVAYNSSTGYLTKTLVGGSATNVVKVATLDSNGQIPIGQIPKAAQERVLVVADDTAKNALTTSEVQVGDVVKVTSTGLMYYVTGASGTTPTYQEFVAGNAAHAALADRATVAEKDTTEELITRYFEDATSSPTSGTAITFTRGDGSSKTIYASDTKNTAGSTNTSSKIFLIGATSQAANPQTYSHDTVYVNTSGNLVAPTFVGALEGNAATATKATQDAQGHAITNYVYSGTVDGNVLTATSGGGATEWTFSVTDRDGKLTAQSWTAGTTAGPIPKFTITNTTYTGNTSSSSTATVTGAAIPVAATNASGVVNTSTQSFAGQKTFTATTASTNKDSGAVIVKGGLGVNGRASSNEVMVGDKAVIKYNGNIVALEFTFE